MIRFTEVTSICCLLAASTAALAQPPAPAPPAPPSPAPKALPAPAAAPQPWPDVNLRDLFDSDAIEQQVQAAMANIDFDAINEQATRAAKLAMDQDENLRRLDENAADWQRKAEEMAAQAQERFGGMMAFAQQTPIAPMPPMPPKPATAPTPFFGQNMRINRNSSGDSLYDRGQRALDNRSFDTALDAFTELANRGGARADAALYWKAYTLNKLGRRDEATAALAELRTKYPASRWLDDAKALELEVKQSAGQKVTPESQSDDELKLLALNGLAQSDPDRAIPILERLLKGAQAPRLKKEAIYVLAANSSPKAQQLLEQIARGSANPDLQLIAIQYLGRSGKESVNHGQLLVEIYNSSSDQAVKRAVLNALASTRDKDRLVQIAKGEKNADLRLDAIRFVGSTVDQAEMWQLYQSETDPAVKQELVRMMSGNTQHLMDIARNDKDAKLRRIAVQSLGSVRAANTSDGLVSLYGTETDPQVKRAIVNSLYSQKNVTALIQLARKESDPDLKREIVRELVSTKSPEANQFLEEILK